MPLSYEDPLTYLPRKPLQEFAKGQIVFGPDKPSDRLYLVILGRVKISATSDDGGQTIARIVCPEGLFGEACMIGGASGAEAVVAIDNVTVMSWTRSEIELQIEREPRLGVALTQYMVRQCLELKDRIESMAIYKTPERVMLAFVQLAATLGTPMADGATRVASLTHHTLAEFVGTSREIVTFQMNRLRRLGLIRYSRQYIDIYVRPIEDALREQGVHMPEVVMEEARRAVG
ncbi:MAG TPA: Crp/Fnr family transcriptional regulator [Bryobacteraceae bacterium]|nr:Crp/Fnr family transcriptional regulator [Bryobacteraceae bacterium]